MRNVLWLVLVGCAPVDAVVTDAPPGGDTDPSGDADTDADGDADADTDADTDTEPDPYPLSWTGERQFLFEAGCDDTVSEEGIEVTQDPDYADAAAICGSCDSLFYVQAGPDRICDGYVPIATEFLRGVDYADSGNGATIYRMDWDGDGWSLSKLAEGDARSDRRSIDYSYEGDVNGYTYVVEGFAVIAP